MENLNVALPPALMYDSAESRAMLSTRRTVSIKPTTGTSVGSAGSGASSSDIIQFKLPNSGVMADCYLRYTIVADVDTPVATSGSAFRTDGLVADPFAPSAGPIRRLVVQSSDGTELSNCNNYHHYCSLMARFKNSQEYSDNQGSILEGCPSLPASVGTNTVGRGARTNFANNENTDGGGAVGASALRIQAVREYEDAEKRLNCKLNKTSGQADGSTGDGSTCGWHGEVEGVVHKFQTGILDQKEGHMLPLALLGSGMNVFLHLNEAKDFLRAVPLNAIVPDTNSNSLNALELFPRSPTGITYSLKDIEMVCSLVYYSPEVMSSIQDKLCNGLKVRTDRVRNQINACTQESNVITLNEHARSVNAVLFGVKNSQDSGSIIRDENEYYKTPTSAGSSVKQAQLAIGAENVPTNPCKFGAQSYCELEKALKAVFDEDFKIGNQVRAGDYHKDRRQDAEQATGGGAGARVGSAVMGFNLKSHPEIPSIMSGKSASSGSIPISLTLDFDGSTSLSNAQVESFVISDQVVEFLADGSALVHK